ncbi:DUF4403 family protein [Mucilaginibacter flavidus]|uniref:DUF4403 family protein n=1 Tax=Mucilaginibacter flavidus TaxID=2949309 RepID=UPI002093A166|nr:DUF4403 family protein [Mucilaginibacter flavidus]MCO5949036.1 DUF4403 family protein [Mucilaginibacter flavidus]
MKLKHPLFYLSAILLLLIFSSCGSLKPLAPATADADIPKLVQPISNIEVPVTVDLKNYFIQAENSVPNKYAGKQDACEGLSYAYTFTRTPFVITGGANTVNLKFTGSYGFTASYCAKCTTILGGVGHCLVPTITGQCGTGDEPPRRMEISYKSVINITPDYHLVSKTMLSSSPKPIDRCNVLLGNIDVTDKLIQYVTGPLNDLGKQVDAKIAAYDIKTIITQLWNNIASETKVGDVGYVSANPQAVRLSGFNLNGSVLSFSVGLSARPVVTTVSARPLLTPLPNLTAYKPASGFNVYLDLLENYDHLTNMVNQQVAGQVTNVAGNEFIVEKARVFGIGKQVVMQLDFKGTNTGTIYLVGTPTYDPATHILTFPDLSFDLQTKAWMLKVAKWMFNGKITDKIRQKASYNFTQFIADSKIRLQKELSRDMTNNTRSDVSIKDLDIMAIYPTKDKLIIRTLSNGDVKVKVVM